MATIATPHGQSLGDCHEPHCVAHRPDLEVVDPDHLVGPCPTKMPEQSRQFGFIARLDAAGCRILAGFAQCDADGGIFVQCTGGLQ